LAGRAPFTSPLAEALAEDVLERLLRYATIDTQAAYRVPHRPSTEKQLELSRLLVEELLELGLEDARLTEDFNVFASLPGAPGVPVVGLIAHVDTTPDVTAEGVSPIVHRAWDGTPIALPGDGRQVLDPDRLPSSPRGSGTTS
jgi:tripeptide aminopeptidase